MTSLILRTTSRFLVALLLLYSIFLLFRGHNHPGGGFVGGLVAASAWALYGIAFGTSCVRASLRVDPLAIVGIGLLLAIGAGALGLLTDGVFLKGKWHMLTLSEKNKVHAGTPLLFDIGIFLIVLGTALAIVLDLEEES